MGIDTSFNIFIIGFIYEEEKKIKKKYVLYKVLNKEEHFNLFVCPSFEKISI